MKGSDSADDETRRTLLRTLAATGLTGAAIGATAGSSVADDAGQGRGRGNEGQGQGRGQDGHPGEGCGRFDGRFKKFKRPITRDGTIVDECEELDKAEPGDEVTFKGSITVTAVNLTDANQLTLSGRLKGKLTGDQSEKIDVRFEDVSLGSIRSLFTVHPTSDSDECPLVELNVGRLFREVLGMELETETVELDIVAIFGEDNLISEFLCSVARRFAPR